MNAVYLCPAKLLNLTKTRVGAVSYLNTKPLLHGIRHHAIMSEIDLVEDYPARIAGMLQNCDLDLGLVPVAALLKLPEWHIVSNYGIGCDGKVASVCLFSEVPVDKIETVLLDYQSRTSVNLARILFRDHWKKEVLFINVTGEDFRKEIKGTTAGVVIGDRALEQRDISAFNYDLGEAWKDFTGLPFVFAAWVSRMPLSQEFTAAFDQANQQGLQCLDEVIAANPSPHYNLKAYYQDCIKYQLTEDMMKGMQLFLEKLKQLPPLNISDLTGRAEAGNV